MGKPRKKGKTGQAVEYISRTQALRKLQLKLPDFRRLCILKGIYPREPKNRKKVSGGNSAPKTYYWTKDINFLAHEPLLQKFREYKVFARKLRKALGKHQISVAKQIEANKPTYTLDHLVRERYPTFVDALRDLDDALCMLFLFARMPQTNVITAEMSERCARLCAEFQHYVIYTHALRKVFLSVKGVYYQAEIAGQSITWIVPYPFAQTVPTDVDYKIMVTFLEFYETLVGFINYKLYADENLAYPPALDMSKEAGAAGLAAFTLQRKDAVAPLAITSTTSSGASATKPSAVSAEVKARLQSLPAKLAQMAQSDASAPTEVSSMEDAAAAGADDDALDDFPPNLAEAEGTNAGAIAVAQSSSALGRLFAGCVFWVPREVPRSLIELVILTCGGKLGWEDGSGSPYTVTSPAITHQLIDRPAVANMIAGRDYIQPQWVFDSLNAQRLLDTHLYGPGKPLPPHLSPFELANPGHYVPPEALTLQQGGLPADRHGAGEEADAMATDAGASENGAEVEDDDDESDRDEEKAHQEELAAEAAGIPYSQYKAEKRDAPKKKTHRVREISEDEEARVLAKTMMRRKDQRLLRNIEQAQARAAKETARLVEKRKAIDAAAGKAAPARAAGKRSTA